MVRRGGTNMLRFPMTYLLCVALCDAVRRLT
jgi:hypothetical protein